jgi:hypothetical protein
VIRPRVATFHGAEGVSEAKASASKRREEGLSRYASNTALRFTHHFLDGQAWLSAMFRPSEYRAGCPVVVGDRPPTAASLYIAEGSHHPGNIGTSKNGPISITRPHPESNGVRADVDVFVHLSHLVLLGIGACLPAAIAAVLSAKTSLERLCFSLRREHRAGEAGHRRGDIILGYVASTCF